MRFISTFFVVLVAVGFALILTKPIRPDKETKKTPPLQWGNPIEGCQLGIIVPRKTFIVGEQIPVTVKVRNAGDLDKGIDILQRSVWFDVKDQEGKAIPLTRFGQRLRTVDAVSHVAHVLKPGQVMTLATYTVSREHDMTLSGTYKIRAWMNVPGRDPKSVVTVFSNEVTIKLEEPPK
jgi:hypothetical protein